MGNFHTTFGATLRKLADSDDAAERTRLYALLASQLEVAFDQQGSNTQVALWDVQEAAYKKIDSVLEQVGDGNLLSAAVLEAIGGLRTDVQNSAVETAARLGKTSEDVAALRADHEALTERVTLIDARHAELDVLHLKWEEVDRRLKEIEVADRADIRAKLEHIEALLAERPAQREAEHQAVADAVIERLGARTNGAQ